MRKITKEELNEILRKHKLWLEGKEGGERANLRFTDLRHTDLRYANLSSADLRFTDLRHTDLRHTDLRHTDLRYANLSSAKNLLTASNFLEANFERTSEGYIAYKTFGKIYQPNTDWDIQKGSVISEIVNANRTEPCGCGINVATLEWVRREYHNAEIWKVLIRWEWLADVCVPYNTDGRIRCGKCELLEIVQ